MKRAVVLGATGMMGGRFIQLLAKHPWFEISALAASDRNVGKSYKDAYGSLSTSEIPEFVSEMEIVEAKPKAVADPDIVFSALPVDVAGSIEEEFAQQGYPVFTNASAHRMDDHVPLLNPEVNNDHSALVETQRRTRKWDGFIVANPNCTTAILTLSLKPLHDNFGLETLIVSSMQAVSGAGYPGVSSIDILGNVVPFIRNEEEKVEKETNKILGSRERPAEIRVSASCHRVPTIHGHMEAVFVKTRDRSSAEEAQSVMRSFESTPQRLKLPSAPHPPIIVRDEDDRPQTRLDVGAGGGMAVSVGRVRSDHALNGLKYVVLGDNLGRGGAGCSILNAELLISQKYIS